MSKYITLKNINTIQDSGEIIIDQIRLLLDEQSDLNVIQIRLLNNCKEKQPISVTLKIECYDINNNIIGDIILEKYSCKDVEVNQYFGVKHPVITPFKNIDNVTISIDSIFFENEFTENDNKAIINDIMPANVEQEVNDNIILPKRKINRKIIAATIFVPIILVICILTINLIKKNNNLIDVDIDSLSINETVTQVTETLIESSMTETTITSETTVRTTLETNEDIHEISELTTISNIDYSYFIGTLESNNDITLHITQADKNYIKGYFYSQKINKTNDVNNDDTMISDCLYFESNIKDNKFYVTSRKSTTLSGCYYTGEFQLSNDEIIGTLTMDTGPFYDINLSFNNAVFSLTSPLPDGNTPGNYANYSAYTSCGGFIYYAGGIDGYHWQLRKSNESGTIDVLLCEDYTDMVLCDGEKVYYRNASDAYKLYSINIDGSYKKQLTASKASYIKLVGGRLYFNEDGNFISMNTDGSEKTILYNDNLYNAQVVNNIIYAINSNGYIYKYSSLNQTGVLFYSPISRNIEIERFFIYNDILVAYAKGDNISYCEIYNINTGEKKYFEADSIASINHDKDYIYCVFITNDVESLITVPIDNFNDGQIYDAPGFFNREFLLIGDYIYSFDLEGVVSIREKP